MIMILEAFITLRVLNEVVSTACKTTASLEAVTTCKAFALTTNVALTILIPRFTDIRYTINYVIDVF